MGNDTLFSGSLRGILLPRIMLVADVAGACGCTVATARRWLRRGRIPGLRLGRRWVVSREQFVASIESASMPTSGGRGHA